MNENTIWFDLDGTLYELYKIDKWLERLRANDASVYGKDVPRHNWKRINRAIEVLQMQGWRVGVITWASMGVNWEEDFFTQTRDVKFHWVCKYFPALADGCFACIPYGYSKAQFLQEIEADGRMNILVDDNKNVRAEWRSHGEQYRTINASRSFVRELEGLAG